MSAPMFSASLNAPPADVAVVLRWDVARAEALGMAHYVGRIAGTRGTCVRTQPRRAAFAEMLDATPSMKSAAA